MQKYFFLLLTLCFSFGIHSQINPINSPRGINGEDLSERDSVRDNRMIDVQLSGKTHYTDYKKISYKGDTTYIDTTLTINKDYIFNFLRKDNFELYY